MATDSVDRKEKKEKKDKKRKHADTTDSADGDVSIVSEKKKAKKEKKRKSTGGDSEALEIQQKAGAIEVDEDGDVTIAEVKAEEAEDDKKAVVKIEIPLAALVPFANPLCDDKAQKKVLKSVKKAAKQKALKRGVKEVVKSLRKSPASSISSSTALPTGIVILAADISPMDVISHIPVLCEDHNVPYLYVPSRAELGAAGATKRPTSVVMVLPKQGGKGKKEGEAAEEEGKDWEEVYRDLNKLAVKLGQYVKV